MNTATKYFETNIVCTTYHSTRDPAADTRSPRLVHLIPGGTGCQAAHEQDHKAEGGHRGADHHEDHLHRFDPQQAEVEDGVEHDDGQRGTAVHGAAEDRHADQAHHGGDQRGVRDAGHA